MIKGLDMSYMVLFMNAAKFLGLWGAKEGFKKYAHSDENSTRKLVENQNLETKARQILVRNTQILYKTNK